MSDEQTTTDEAFEAPKPKKAAQALQVAAQIADLEARVAKIEKNQKVTVDGFEFAANEVRPIYGFGALAVIFDAIAKKLRGE